MWPPTADPRAAHCGSPDNSGASVVSRNEEKRTPAEKPLIERMASRLLTFAGWIFGKVDDHVGHRKYALASRLILQRHHTQLSLLATEKLPSQVTCCPSTAIMNRAR